MVLVVLLRKPPKHVSIVHIRLRATVPAPEKEIAVTVNRGRSCSLAVLQHAPNASYAFSLIRICLIPLYVLDSSMLYPVSALLKS